MPPSPMAPMSNSNEVSAAAIVSNTDNAMADTNTLASRLALTNTITADTKPPGTGREELVESINRFVQEYSARQTGSGGGWRDWCSLRF